jgi:ubiquinone biosynthesis protein UbiJ
MKKRKAAWVGKFHEDAVPCAFHALENAITNELSAALPLKQFATPLNEVISAAKRDAAELAHLKSKVARLESRLAKLGGAA